MVERDGAAVPAAGGPRAPCAGRGSTGTLAVAVAVGVGVSLGETGGGGVVTMGVAAAWLDRRAGAPMNAGIAKPRGTATRINPAAMRTTGEIRRLPGLTIPPGETTPRPIEQ